jgi:hypothetical protein
MTIRFMYPIAAAVAVASLVSGCASTTPVQPRIDLLGMPVIDQAAARTITITPDTRWVNVTAGDTIRFATGSQTFAWSFQSSPNIAMFDLNQIAPPGALGRRVPVYITPNPLYGTGG